MGDDCTRLLARQAPQRRMGTMWRRFLLVITLCLCAHYLAVGWVAVGNLDNDAAYYYGVARHIATTGRYEEPIIWQYLNPPATLIHRPFDYWQGLTALLLVPWLALFGATHHVALVTMAVISGLGLLAFYYLTVFALPLRHAWVQ